MMKHNEVVFVILIGSACAFTLVKQVARPQRTTNLLATKKGFSSAEPKKSTKKSSISALEKNPVEETSSGPRAEEKKTVVAVKPQEQPVNAGQRALKEMRRQRAEEKDAELRRVRDLLQADAQLSETPAVIPETVAQRMGKRMLPFVGLPLFGGMGAFVAFWYLATYKNMEFQPALVAGSTIGILAIGLLVRLNSAGNENVAVSIPYLRLTDSLSFRFTGHYVLSHERVLGS